MKTVCTYFSDCFVPHPGKFHSTFLNYTIFLLATIAISEKVTCLFMQVFATLKTNVRWNIKCGYYYFLF